jgi:hypothetical protein
VGFSFKNGCTNANGAQLVDNTKVRRRKCHKLVQYMKIELSPKGCSYASRILYVSENMFYRQFPCIPICQSLTARYNVRRDCVFNRKLGTVLCRGSQPSSSLNYGVPLRVIRKAFKRYEFTLASSLNKCSLGLQKLYCSWRISFFLRQVRIPMGSVKGVDNYVEVDATHGRLSAR